MRRVTRAEMAGVVAWAVALMALTAIPYALAVGEAGPARHFAGILWGVDDGNAHLAWIRQAADGRLLLRNQYTVRAQNPHFFNLFFLALGRVCRATGLGPQQVYTGSRYALGVFCLVAIYLLAAELTSDRRARALALALASVSSGLGWAVVLLGKGGAVLPGFALFPMDVADGWQAAPEALIFTSVLLNPLFAFSLGLVALTMLFASRLVGEEAPSRRPWAAAAWCGLVLLVLGNVHGYDIFPLHAAIVVWLAVSCATRRASWGRAAGQYALIVGISLASPLWGWVTARLDPAYLAKINTLTASPRPVDVAAGYGLVLALALVGAWLACRGPKRGEDAEGWRPRLAVVWAVCGFAALYLPVAFQRKMLEGLHIPLCLLGGMALAAVLRPAHEASFVRYGLSPPTRALLVAALILVTVPSNVLFIAGCLRQVRSNNRDLLGVRQPPLVLTQAEVQAMDWLGAHASERDIVLCSSLTGNHIPVHARCLVYVGHWAETLDFARYLRIVEAFYDPHSTPEVREEALGFLPPSYVWWGPQERLLQEGLGGPAEDPCQGLPGLTEVYRNLDVSIYQARPGTGPQGGGSVAPAR